MRIGRFAILLASMALIVMCGSSFSSRSALSFVVKACQASFDLTGSSFPCLKVVAANGGLTSYAIMREPTDDKRTILSPIADITGIEDPRLLRPGSPNYFEKALENWSEVFNAAGQGRSIALAINAQINRSQDQLHIHMGCAMPNVIALLDKNVGGISDKAFKRLTFPIKGRYYWARRFERDDLALASPFIEVAEGVPGAAADMGRVTIALLQSNLARGRSRFYLLAETARSGRYMIGTAESLVDPGC